MNASAAIALPALLLAALSAPAQAAPELIRPGLFHGDEINADADTHDWFGLYATADGFELAETRVTVRPVFDPMADLPGEATGLLVTANSDDEPLILVRGVPGMIGGPVETAIASPDALEVGDSRSLADGPDGWYALAAFGTAEPSEHLYGRPQVREYELRLYHHPPLSLGAAPEAPSSQALVSFDALDDSRPQLIWAGDLDGDGKLDLLLDATFHYNVSDYTLWTSRGASGDALVEQVASFAISGC